MSPLDSIRLMVDNYPGGRAVIAMRLGKTDEVLRKELSGATSHKLGVVDACLITQLCNEASSAHASAFATSVASYSGGFVELPVREMSGCLVSEKAHLLKETSDVFTAIASSLADGAISGNDLKAIESEALDLIEQFQKVLGMVRARHEADKPAHLRAAA